MLALAVLWAHWLVAHADAGDVGELLGGMCDDVGASIFFIVTFIFAEFGSRRWLLRARCLSMPQLCAWPALHRERHLLRFNSLLSFFHLHYVYTFEAVLVAAFWDDKLSLWLVLHGLLWCKVSLTMGWLCWLCQRFFIGYAEYGTWSAVACSLWWQVVRRQHDICMIFSVLVWTHWLAI